MNLFITLEDGVNALSRCCKILSYSPSELLLAYARISHEREIPGINIRYKSLTRC